MAKTDWHISERAALRAEVQSLRKQLAESRAEVAAQKLAADRANDRASGLANALSRSQFEEAKARGCYSNCPGSPFRPATAIQQGGDDEIR